MTMARLREVELVPNAAESLDIISSQERKVDKLPVTVGLIHTRWSKTIIPRDTVAKWFWLLRTTVFELKFWVWL